MPPDFRVWSSFRQRAAFGRLLAIFLNLFQCVPPSWGMCGNEQTLERVPRQRQSQLFWPLGLLGMSFFFFQTHLRFNPEGRQFGPDSSYPDPRSFFGLVPLQTSQLMGQVGLGRSVGNKEFLEVCQVVGSGH